MFARWTIVPLLSLVLAVTAQAQAPMQFRWQKDQVLAYQVKQVTTVTEVVGGKEQRFRSQLDLRKSYRITDVDDRGIATLDYRLTAMRNEQTRPNGEVLLFDSANPEKSTAGLREQMAKYVGQTLAVIRVDPRGNVVEVKKGPAGRYAAEPPFTIVLPAEPVRQGTTWERDYDVILEPPLGTGEKYKAHQGYTCRRNADGKATLFLKTDIKSMPEAVQEQLPLVQKETAGEVIFDVVAGRVSAVRLAVDRKLENHQGAGSSYHFKSTHSEQYVAE